MDKITLHIEEIKSICEKLFGNSSLNKKIIKWIENENTQILNLSIMNKSNEQIESLKKHIKKSHVSASYLLEYLLIEFLPSDKRWIDEITNEEI